VLLERLRGESFATLDRALARQAIPALCHAVVALHETYGVHGDLKPPHVYLEGDEVVLIDPVGEGEWIGSVGYSLGLPPWGSLKGMTQKAQDAHLAVFGVGPMSREVLEEVSRLRDLGALAAIVAELYEGSLRWDRGVLYGLGDGPGRAGLECSVLWSAMEEGTQPVPEPYRTWVLSAAESALGVWQGRRPEPGWCRQMLTRLASM
jgi:hypothetical protein